MMTPDILALRKTAASLGMTDTADGWYGPLGIYGIEQHPETLLLHAVGPNNSISEAGASAEVATALLVSWCPDAEEVQSLIDAGDVDEARLEGADFVRAWDINAVGTARVHAICAAPDTSSVA